MASALHVLAAGIVVCSVPAIGATLHVTHGAELVVSVFFVGAGLGVLVGGRVADVLGPRRVLLGVDVGRDVIVFGGRRAAGKITHVISIFDLSPTIKN